MADSWTDTKEHITTVYDKHRNRKFDCYLPIHLFGTGSEGNSVFFKDMNLLIDMGLPYKRYIEKDPNFFNYVDAIILTHHHGDHFNPATVHKVLKEYPHINFIITDHMFNEITDPHYKAQYETEKNQKGETLYTWNQSGGRGKPIYKINELGERVIVKSPWMKKFISFKNRFYIIDSENILNLEIPCRNNTVYMKPCTTKHGDIENLAIALYDSKNQEYILYASDLDDLRGKSTFTDKNQKFIHVTGLPQEYMFDKIFLEANYDENILTEWMKIHIDYVSKARAKGSMRHISEQEAFDYIEKFLKDDGCFIPLHASKTFGTLIQKIDE